MQWFISSIQNLLVINVLSLISTISGHTLFCWHGRSYLRLTWRFCTTNFTPSDFHLTQSPHKSLNGQVFSSEYVKIHQEDFYTNKNRTFCEQRINRPAQDIIKDTETKWQLYRWLKNCSMFKCICINIHVSEILGFISKARVSVSPEQAYSI